MASEGSNCRCMATTDGDVIDWEVPNWSQTLLAPVRYLSAGEISLIWSLADPDFVGSDVSRQCRRFLLDCQSAVPIGGKRTLSSSK